MEILGSPWRQSSQGPRLPWKHDGNIPVGRSKVIEDTPRQIGHGTGHERGSLLRIVGLIRLRT